MILLAGRAYLAHAQFNLRFDSPTRLMGLSKAALYMSCPDFDDPGGAVSQRHFTLVQYH
jgi:hypothetical protein